MATSRIQTNPLIFNLAGLGALSSIGLVTVGLLNPQIGYKLSGLPDPTIAVDRKTRAHLTWFWASRELHSGMVARAAWYYGDRKTLGWMYILGAALQISDGEIKQRQGGDTWKHVMWVPLMVGLGIGLIGWDV